MSSKLRKLAIFAGVVLLVLLILPFLIPVNQFRPAIEEKISASLGRKVQVGNLSLSLLSGSLSAENLSIADDPKFSSSPFLTAKSFRVGVEIMPLIFSRSLHVTGLTIEKPEVTLLKDAAGKWNFSSIGAAPQKHSGSSPSSAPSSSGGSSDLTVKNLEIQDGRISIGIVGSSKRSVYDKVSIEASGVSFTAAFPVKITASLPGGGSFKLDGRVGPVNPNDASHSPLTAKLSVNGFDLASSGVLDSSAGLAGVLDLNADIASQDGEARTKGTMKLNKLLLVAGGTPSRVPAAVDFSTNYDLRKNSGVLNPSTIKIGNASARIAGAYQSPGDTTIVNLKFDGQNMPARDLEAFLPALGINLPKGASLASGTLSGNLNIQGPTNRLITTGTLGLYNAKLTGFNLGSKLAAISALTGIKTGSDLDIEKFVTNIRIAPDGLRAENLNAIVLSLGTLVGAGTVDSKNNLDFKMLATLTTGSTASVAGGVSGILGGLMGKGKTSKDSRIPFLIQGTASDPKFIPDLGGLAAEMLKSQLGGLTSPTGVNGTNQPSDDPLTSLGNLFKKKKP